MWMSRIRLIHTATASLSAKSSPLFKLRQKTGLAYNLCREALQKHDNNLEEAEAWLKAQELSHGLQKATKVCGRSTREGLIGIAVQQDHKLATLVELNCETDFVAKNQMFKDFLVDLTERISIDRTNCTRFELPGQDYVHSLRPDEGALDTIQKDIAPMISKLGENIRITKAMHFEVDSQSDASIFGRIHAEASRKATDQHSIVTGRFGAMVALRPLDGCPNLSRQSFIASGNRLCQHVIGFSPTYIELPDNIRKHLEEAEKEQALKRERENEANENESEEGNLSDDEGVNGNQNHRDDWPSIMDQTLIMSDAISVREFCKKTGISIVYFNRFECGADQ